MQVDKSEIRKGLLETRRYLLSHHEKSEWYRCYTVDIFSRRVRVCARCLGIYPGILAGVLVGNVAVFEFPYLPLIFVLPLPTLVDWILTSLTRREGYNVVRTGTGAILGFGYGLSIVLLITDRDPRILAVGGIYAIAVGVLLILKEYIKT